MSKIIVGIVCDDAGTAAAAVEALGEFMSEGATMAAVASPPAVAPPPAAAVPPPAAAVAPPPAAAAVPPPAAAAPPPPAAAAAPPPPAAAAPPPPAAAPKAAKPADSAPPGWTMKDHIKPIAVNYGNQYGADAMAKVFAHFGIKKLAELEGSRWPEFYNMCSKPPA